MDDAFVPQEGLIGDEGSGFADVMHHCDFSRPALGLLCLGAAKASLYEAMAFATEREAFGQPIMDYQNTKFVLAECKADVLAGKTLIDHCVQRCIGGNLDAATASMAKLWATEMQCKVVDKCLQIFGGYG